MGTKIPNSTKPAGRCEQDFGNLKKTENMKKITILFALFISIVGYSQTYKLYQTDNIHNQLKLNTKTGQVYQIQDDGQTFLVREAETPNNEKENRYVLQKTKNIWTFLLLDKSTGKLWQCQFSASSVKDILSVAINTIDLTNSEDGEFTLQPMTSMYQFYLTNQKTGEMWMVQWTTKGADYRWIKKL